MSRFDECIDAVVANGKITKAVGEQIKSSDDPEGVINSLIGQTTRIKREKALEAARMAQAWEWINAHPDGPAAGLMSILSRDVTGKAKNFNVDYLSRVYQGKFHAKFADGLSKFRTRMLGFSQDEAGLKKLVDAVHGQQIDDPDIQAIAQEWLNLAEEIRTTFNAKGGSISKKDDWALPQSHDIDLVFKAGKDVWKKFLLDERLDIAKMTDDTGRQLTDDELDKALDYIYDTISTGGLNKAKDFTVPRLGTKLSRKGSERRFLHFKDGQAWVDYQNRFGRGDIFANFTDYIDSYSNDIAVMEMLGPNPKTMFDTLMTQVDKEVLATGKRIPQTKKWEIEANFNVVTGKVNEGQLTTLADFTQSARNVLTASTLGSAFLSAIADLGFSTITSRVNNLSPVAVINRQMALMNPANEADRIAAVKIGLIADTWTNRANAANRYADAYGNGMTAKVAEGVMRGSLLSSWTDAGRKSLGMEYSSMLADNFSKTFDQLDSAVQKAFDYYNITPDDWNVFRTQKHLDHKGAKFADMTQPGGEKFHRMVLTETDYAVPTPDARVRAITTGGLSRASMEGQVWRSAMMLKSFPVAMIYGHLARGWYQATTGDRFTYLGSMLVMSTIFGGLAVQAKDIASGKEPRPTGYNDGDVDVAQAAKFIGASFMQGGGVGLFGDLLFSDVNRFGGGITSTFTGPTGDLIDKTFKLTIGNVQQAIAGEETNVLGEATQYLKRYTPKTWQIRLAVDSFYDQIEMQLNPDAQRRFNQTIKKRQADFDQDYWQAPGEPIF